MKYWQHQADEKDEQRAVGIFWICIISSKLNILGISTLVRSKKFLAEVFPLAFNICLIGRSSGLNFYLHAETERGIFEGCFHRILRQWYRDDFLEVVPSCKYLGASSTGKTTVK